MYNVVTNSTNTEAPMKTEANAIVFESTGKRHYVNNAIVGLSPSLFVTGGYDDDIKDITDFTSEERIELADFMIAQWQRFRDGG